MLVAYVVQMSDKRAAVTDQWSSSAKVHWDRLALTLQTVTGIGGHSHFRQLLGSVGTHTSDSYSDRWALTLQTVTRIGWHSHFR